MIKNNLPAEEASSALLYQGVKQMTADDVTSVRHGRWKRNKNGTYSCSECQSWIPNEQKHYANFCLYCGARMDKEENNERSSREVNA